MKITRYIIKVEGIVQGVGFRPFVYNLATSFNLKGWVNNTSEGVYIDLEGSKENIELFLKNLSENPPPLAKIERINYKTDIPVNYTNFSIKKSLKMDSKITLISPDISICKDCLDDIKNPTNRRYKYAFTNCTNCGPRFSIIEDTPYDRKNTTLKIFKMCKHCNNEYTDPYNRRFHAEPNACEVCGPRIWLTDCEGKEIKTLNNFKWAGDALKNGKILAIKGLGSFHLVCDASNKNSIEQLRNRKHRPHKPLAIMAKDIDTIKKYCEVSAYEESILTGIRKPILLLRKKKDCYLPENIAPNQNYIGMMLPYTPINELLFDFSPELLIMTSGNLNTLPLEYDNSSAINNLSNIADFFMIHNRNIHVPIDDSVAKILNNKLMLIRRARGFVPDPIKFETSKSILAFGSDMKNTFCISKENFLFVSQHNGDLKNIETINNFKRNIEHYKKIFKFQPEVIACDMHPDYISTKYAEEFNLPLVHVQHHHAHIASCMVENNITHKLIGIAFDGTGYGTDGNVWGGEFFVCNLSNFERIAHIEYVLLPGGDIAVSEPWRMATSYINYALKDSNKLENTLTSILGEKSLIINSMINSNFNCIKTSSMGRLFDAVAAILGVETTVTYEGQASIELESIIDESITENYKYEIIKEGSEYIIQTSKIINGILEDMKSNIKVSSISAKFHNTIICFSIDICNIIRKEMCINEVALSGGVFQNNYLYKKLSEKLLENKFTIYSNTDFPTNDGGISLGQIAIANAKLNGKNE